jgi:hypothetical protein
MELEVAMSILGDIKSVEQEAADELREERVKAAKGKIKTSLQTIAKAEAVLAQARRDHAVLLETIAAE